MNKLQSIKTYLEGKFLERENEIEGILLALLARQHVLLIGPPGTGKSAIVSEINKIVTDTKYFQWLLTRFSTPEELFGPLSLKDLEQGVYKRNTANKLPEANIAFLDEIFKSNSAILNSLLTLINERVFYNNGGAVQTPIMSIVGASNEYPETGEGLDALFDRFLLRYEVDYINDNQNFINMLQNNSAYVQPPQITLQELQELQFFCEMVTIPKDVLEKLALIRQEMKVEGIHPSDRRFKQSLSILKAKAYLNGRNTVNTSDVLVLCNSLWEEPEQKDIANKIVKNFAQDDSDRKLDNISNDAKDIEKLLSENGAVTEIQLEASSKLKKLIKESDSLLKENPNKQQEIEVVQNKLKAMQQSIADSILNF